MRVPRSHIRHAVALGVLLAGSGCVGSVLGSTPAISAARMRSTVEILAAPQMRGRRVGTAENERAARWIAAQFEAIGLLPAVAGSYFHEFDFAGRRARNVAGIVEAAGIGGRGQAGEYVVIGAHFDGIGDRGEKHNPAADDNASGVAALLEIARAITAMRPSLRRNVVFAAFDAEEAGLVGSTRFVLDEVIPTRDTRLAIIFDLIGGRFFPWQDKRVIAMGSEHSAAVRSALMRLRADRPTPVELLGTYVLEPAGPLLARSDYRAYRQAGVPYVFFSTGTPWYYHTEHDATGQIDFEQAAEVARFALDLLLEVTTDAWDVDFVQKPEPEVHDLQQLHGLIEEILAHREQVRLQPVTFRQIEKMRDALARAIANGKPSRVLAHHALRLIFAAAKKSRPQ